MAIITGTGGNDTLNGTSGNDQIFGLGGDDILNGNGGNDQLDGGTGADTMNGGTGNDTYFVDDAGDVVNENSGEGTDTVRVASLAAYALTANVEKLINTGSGTFTGTGNDLSNDMTGGSGADTLYGNDGYDQLYGNGGDDFLYGGADGDLLSGGTGADYMEGGTGGDVYIVDNAGDSVVEASGEGVDEVYTSLATYTLGNDVENLYYNGGAGNFTLTGNALDNIIFGGGGNDTLSGLDGNDTLRGQTGNDTLSGGDGTDLLVGGSGVDDLTGGAGADTFRFSTFESGTGANADRIQDFAQGSDIIDVAGIDADLLTAGNQTFSFIGNAAFSGAAGELRYYDNGTDTFVQGDINGDGAADFDIALTGVVALVSADFIL
jgi:Ca2+-binding RTX toxin-like protein